MNLNVSVNDTVWFLFWFLLGLKQHFPLSLTVSVTSGLLAYFIDALFNFSRGRLSQLLGHPQVWLR